MKAERAAARKILEDAFGEPANEQRRQIIEEILDKIYGPAKSPKFRPKSLDGKPDALTTHQL